MRRVKTAEGSFEVSGLFLQLRAVAMRGGCMRSTPEVCVREAETVLTRFGRLCEERGWGKYQVFRVVVSAAAKRAAREEETPRLASVVVSARTFRRWKYEGLEGLPWTDTGIVLSYAFDMPVQDLFSDEDPAGQPVAAEVIPEFVGPPLEFDSPADVVARAHQLVGSSDGAVVAMAEKTIASVVSRYEALGPWRLQGEVLVLHRLLNSLLSGPQPPGRQRSLFRLTSCTAGLLAYMAVNVGQADAADAYCTQAELLAREIGDMEMQLWALGTRSFGLYYQGRYREADQAAAAGVALAPENPQAIRLLANGQARALAQAGDSKGAERALGRAMELSGRQKDLPAGISSCIAFTPYSHARTVANAATAHLSLGRTNQVLRAAEEINELVETSSSSWSKALVRLDAAMALLHQPSPEVEQAMALGLGALQAGTAAPIRSVVQRSHDLYQAAVARWPREPVVGEYAEQLRTWPSRPALSFSAGGLGP